MNKSDLINKLSRKLYLYKEDDVEKSVNIIIELISDSLSRNKRVEVRNFGTFSVRTRCQRVSRNPKTGTSVLVEAKHHPYFRASKKLKESLKK